MISYSEPIHPFVFRVEITPAFRLLPWPGRWRRWWWEIMVRRYNTAVDLTPGIRDPFVFRIPDSDLTTLLPAVSDEAWTTLGYERGGSGGRWSLRKAILSADRAVWQFFERLDAEEQRGVRVR